MNLSFSVRKFLIFLLINIISQFYQVTCLFVLSLLPVLSAYSSDVNRGTGYRLKRARAEHREHSEVCQDFNIIDVAFCLRINLSTNWLSNKIFLMSGWGNCGSVPWRRSESSFGPCSAWVSFQRLIIVHVDKFLNHLQSDQIFSYPVKYWKLKFTSSIKNSDCNSSALW